MLFQFIQDFWNKFIEQEWENDKILTDKNAPIKISEMAAKFGCETANMFAAKFFTDSISANLELILKTLLPYALRINIMIENIVF